MKLKNLAKNPKNPRVITDEKREMLKKAMAKFGDISGIVFNRKTKHLVGGHQRQDVIDDGEITITKKYSQPTKTGTVAEGFVNFKGEKFSYREVEWSEQIERAANIAANKGAGDWDEDLLSEWMQDLKKSDFDMGLTMFDETERLQFFTEAMGVKINEKELDENLETTHSCPKCGYEY